ncbi:glycosyltransferase family 2 protein [Lentibacter sp. XHP0401]|uniref:glycosyltransferase family 2 protein n=1 Tax=Lentibacter sp. XHP0401 TaxID=2984334 RepID=UPI0021E8B12B|nr:glycosyltransferase family 2 protein [Lentibacter sp. XHP0401]MCV2894589.1 glycosyltransferase [Lentibacter sp. XHP0401]
MYALKQQPLDTTSDFGRYLVDMGLVSPSALIRAKSECRELNASLQSCLEMQGALSADELSEASASYLDLPLVELTLSPPDPNLSALFDPALLIRYGVIPWRKTNRKTTLLCSNSENYRDFLARLDGDPSVFEFAIAKQSHIMNWLTGHHRDELTRRASARVPEDESCRGWERHTSRRRLFATIVGLLVVTLLVALHPQAVFGLFAAWAVFTLVVSAVMRLASYISEVSKEQQDCPPPCPQNRLPHISVLVPLFKEREIANVLLARLMRLTYPKALLDVVLVVEESDELTKSVLQACSLPQWMRVVEVPEGTPKTKPRAMNYALDFCKGDIIGIWDAEDAPAHDQLQIVADHFHSAGEDLVCLQGILDYYNSRQNWLARCFTIEYAAWFRLILPGMARLGFAIPLGGTTLFFRRKPLEEIGGWDAHNVTEDADLGFRLARHGYRTDVIPTRTGEEANCRLWPWVRQRSRWLKGYMVTYLVHMRSPRRLLREVGLWRFIGFHAHFLTALSQFVLAPVLWSFWLVLFGLPHPLEAFIERDLLLILGLSFLGIELINALINATAVSKPTLRHLFAWVPTMHFYYPLGAIAAYKALFELVVKPFYWDKTQHGISLYHQKKVNKNS